MRDQWRDQFIEPIHGVRLPYTPMSEKDVQFIMDISDVGWQAAEINHWAEIWWDIQPPKAVSYVLDEVDYVDPRYKNFVYHLAPKGWDRVIS